MRFVVVIVAVFIVFYFDNTDGSWVQTREVWLLGISVGHQTTHVDKNTRTPAPGRLVTQAQSTAKRPCLTTTWGGA